MSENLYGRLKVLESEERPLDRLERLRAMNGPLLFWYGEHARVLPWRENPSPYRVWISEIMLQQTRVEAVKPYFVRFLRELPDAEALAAVPEDRLLKLWEGLGYYNRARNLKKAAKILVEEYDGRLPDSREELMKLPGIGSYTAGAIASIAYGKPEPAVDGNVLRVLSRILASREDIRSQAVKNRFENDLARTMPKENCSAFNQGLIEIGAVVCVPNGEPRCGACPFCSICLAGRQGLTDSIPYKSPPKPRRVEERTVLLIRAGGRVALRKRPAKGLLASLYEFPSLEGRCSQEEVKERWIPAEASGCAADSEPAGSDASLTVRSISRAPDAAHVFSHVEWHMTGYLLEVDVIPETYLSVEPRELTESYPLPSALERYVRFLREEAPQDGGIGCAAGRQKSAAPQDGGN